MSDLYFCKNCCLGWYDNKWMMCCKGCVGHKESGWSLKDMQTTYGVAMKELIKQQTSPNYFFPLIHRPYPPPTRLLYNAKRSNTTPLLLLLPDKFQKYNKEWLQQQQMLLQQYAQSPTKSNWTVLDPEIQHLFLIF